MDAEGRGDRFQKLEESYKDYTVYDQHYEKIGKVDDLFVDESDEPEYIGVKMGFLGMKSTLIPMEIARVNDRRQLIEVAADKDAIENAPTFDNDKDITPDYEGRVHQHFGLERPDSWNERGGYGSYHDSDREAHTSEDLTGTVDTEYGERKEESSQRPLQSTSTGEERYDTHSSSPREPGRSDLDLPLGDTDRESSRDRPEYGESSTESSTTFGGPDDPLAEERRQDDSGERESSNLRVYKRTRR